MDKFTLAPHLVGTNYEISDALQSCKNEHNSVDLRLDYFDGEAPRHIRSALASATLSEDPANHQDYGNCDEPLIGRELDADGAAAINRSSKFDFPLHLIGLNKSAEEELRPYLEKYRPVDLGIDLLDDGAPMFIREAMANATLSDDPYANQLTHPNGMLRLREAIAKMYSPLIGHKLDPEDNVVVTEGATEAVFAAFTGHTSPGDEWIVIEPAYLMYVPMIKMSKGVPRYTSLKLVKTNGTINGDDWVLDKEEMEGLFNTKTKGILLNNPLNPIGKVYTLEELELIASLAKKYNVMIVCDEAHEWITHKPHIRIASLPGMYERTVTIGTASKSFSVAGFRIGWAYGHANLLDHVKTAHEVSVYCSAAPQQIAVAYAFEREQRIFGAADSYFVTHLQTVKEQRDTMIAALEGTGITPVIADGGFCMLANWSALRNRIPCVKGSMDFVKWLIENVGVLGLPLPAFYGDEHKYIGEDFVRFCFHKKISTLEEAARRFKKLQSALK